MSSMEHAWVEIKLPSEGRLYGGKIPEGKIHIRKQTTREEALLQSQGISMLERISRIVNACSKLPENFDPMDLLLTDRLTILLSQRIVTFGSMYTFTWRCTTCRTTNKSRVSLTEELNDVTPEAVDARLSEMDPPQSWDWVEPFPLDLPDAKVQVGLRFLRGKDEMELVKATKKARLNSAVEPGDPSYFLRLGRMIATVDGDPMTDVRKDQFMKGMSATDAATIRNAVERRETGIDMRMVIACPACGADIDMTLPFDAEFFQPTDL